MKYGKIIKGNLVITKNCKDDFSEVVEIKGYCDIHSDVELPKLTTIGGYCSSVLQTFAENGRNGLDEFMEVDIW